MSNASIDYWMKISGVALFDINAKGHVIT